MVGGGTDHKIGLGPNLPLVVWRGEAFFAPVAVKGEDRLGREQLGGGGAKSLISLWLRAATSLLDRRKSNHSVGV